MEEILTVKEYKEVPGVTLRCIADSCKFKTEGTIYFIDKAQDAYNVKFSPVMNECVDHHNATGRHDNHNMFRLSMRGIDIGQVSTPEGSFTGTIWDRQAVEMIE